MITTKAQVAIMSHDIFGCSLYSEVLSRLYVCIEEFSRELDVRDDQINARVT